jgi:environmental stress-induced protein Ves
MPWKNGAGSTREYFREPAIDWRLSVAEVASDGPFSTFPGLDRALVLLSGRGMELTSAEWTVRLTSPLRCFEFPGDLPISATLVDGPTTDLNVMWRRDVLRADAVVRVGAVDLTVGGDGLVVGYLIDGAVDIGNASLGPGDAAVWNSAERVRGTGSLVLFTLTPTSPMPC